MNPKPLERGSFLVAALLVVLTVTACAIRLRGDEVPTTALAQSEVAPDPLATKLAQCRSVTDQQKDALVECRKLWTEQRRRFLGQQVPALLDSPGLQSGPRIFVAPKDESRLRSGYPSIQPSGKE